MKIINPSYAESIMVAANKSPYFTLLSMKLRKLEVGSCTIEINLDQKHFQPFGVAHGGVFASIIDAAAFWAVYSEVDESLGMTSVDLKLNYLAPAFSGNLIATGVRIKLGRTLGLGEAQVVDEKGRILAHGTSTVMILSDFPFEAHGTLPPKFIEQP